MPTALWWMEGEGEYTKYKVKGYGIGGVMGKQMWEEGRLQRGSGVVVGQQREERVVGLQVSPQRGEDTGSGGGVVEGGAAKDEHNKVLNFYCTLV